MHARSRAFRSAPALSNAVTTAGFLVSAAARCKGVLPYSLRSFKSAPARKALRYPLGCCLFEKTFSGIPAFAVRSRGGGGRRTRTPCPAFGFLPCLRCLLLQTRDPALQFRNLRGLRSKPLQLLHVAPRLAGITSSPTPRAPRPRTSRTRAATPPPPPCSPGPGTEPSGSTRAPCLPRPWSGGSP